MDVQRTDEILRRFRDNLLGTERRNRLVNFRARTQATNSLIERVVEVVDERSTDVYSKLVLENKVMRFVGKPDKSNSPAESNDTESESHFEDFDDFSLNVTDEILKTSLLNSRLDRHLTKIARDQVEMLEEQGINALYLAVGMLEWYEADHSKERRMSPLILVPVLLERTERGKHKVTWDGSEIGTNLSLTALLKSEFGIDLPQLPVDDIDVSDYIKQVTQAVKAQSGWKVHQDAIALSFFSFAKFRIFKDLEPSSWPESRNILKHDVLQSLFNVTSFKEVDNPLADDDFLDEYRQIGETNEIFDTDSSQTLAILQAMQGSSMVIEGPPGTGKSQTIANLIAEFVGSGKTVLFVSEKAAALNVVFDNLKRANLDQCCLELHGTKTNKRYFYQKLEQTIKDAQPRLLNAKEVLRQLETSRNKLNIYVEEIHSPIGFKTGEYSRHETSRGITPREAIARLINLGPEIDTSGRFDGSFMHEWSQSDFEQQLELVNALQSQLKVIGYPPVHPFHGTSRTYISPDDKRELQRKIDEAVITFQHFQDNVNILTQELNLDCVERLDDLCGVENVVSYIVSAPNVSGVNFHEDGWQVSTNEILRAIETGERKYQIKQSWETLLVDNAWNEDLNSHLNDFTPMGLIIGELSLDICQSMDELTSTICHICTIANKISHFFDIEVPSLLWNQVSLSKLAKRFANAPNCIGLKVDSPKWFQDYKLIQEAISCMSTVRSAQELLKNRVKPDAWNLDARFLLSSFKINGATALKRILNSDYRAAYRQIRIVCQLDSKLSYSEAKEILLGIESYQTAHSRLLDLKLQMFELFGERWNVQESNLDELTQCTDFLAQLHREISESKYKSEVTKLLNRREILIEIGKLGEQLTSQLEFVSFKMKEYRKLVENAYGSVFEDLTGDPSERLFKWVKERLNPLCAKIDSLYKIPEHERKWAERVKVYHAIQQYQAANQSYLEVADLLHSCVGNFHQQNGTWRELELQVKWTIKLFNDVNCGSEAASVLAFFKKNVISVDLSERLDALKVLRDTYSKQIDGITCDAQLEGGGRHFLEKSLAEQMFILKAWQEYAEDIESYFRFNLLAKQANDHSMASVTDLAQSWELASERLTTEFQRHWYNFLLSSVMESRPILQEFDRKHHEEIASTFKKLDKELIKFNRVKVALHHWKAVPRGSAVGDMGFLQQQMHLKRSHKSIRFAMSKAPLAIQAIKPVFLMSPMSVAMYLPPEGPAFDVVIFDEASQIKPEDAIGSIVRAKQMIVVGDSKQMPPTSFFDRMTGADELDGETDDDYEAQALGEQESILALATARIPEKSPNRRDLRWHYRSKHQDLIATSNRLFYKDRLIIFPAAVRSTPESGLLLRHDPDTVYARGASRKNEREAKAVVEAIINHIKQTPDRTLGVVAFSKAQQEAIEDYLDLARKTEPAFRDFDQRHGQLDRLFIKNLESVQGDERDVVFISVGYGRDANGFLSMSFGPLNREGGERRLNVLITRAKHRTVIFSNFKASDMRMGDVKGEGIRALHTFLSFAESGHLDVTPAVLKLEPSVFEEQVFEKLRNRGFDVDQQVGSEGFYIDMAVRNPNEPGRYSIGIECDGAMYHSARSTRDRDRLRQQVLEDRGWTLHRIWSTDWWRHPERELARCIEAIENSFNRSGLPATQVGVSWDEQILVDEEKLKLKQLTLPVDDEVSSNVTEYKVAEIQWQGNQILEVSNSYLSGLVETIALVEAPIHIDEVIRRIREAAGKGRAGNQIRDKILNAIRLAKRQQKIVISDSFIYMPNQDSCKVRNRKFFPQLKKIEIIAPEEILEAAIVIFISSVAVERTHLAKPIAELLGFERVTPETAGHIDRVISKMVADGWIVDSNGKLTLSDLAFDMINSRLNGLSIKD
jgi:very-short-patch-repair endonuclease